MSQLSCGIVGLPNVGKSSLFNALTRKSIDIANYPFCTIEPNVGVVNVPDHRLCKLSDLSKSKKLIPAVMKFVDIAGLVEGASKGEGLGNKFLSNIRETDAIIHVVRCFEDKNITHVSGSINPVEDVKIINLELILADLQMCENALEKIRKQVRGKKASMLTLTTMEKVQKALNDNKLVSQIEFTEEEKEAISTYCFMTDKRVLYVANIAENDVVNVDANQYYHQLKQYVESEGSALIPICACLESEVAQLSEEDASEMLQALGMKDSGLNRLIKASYQLLGLITFLTTGEQETRAWTIEHKMMAHQAAGKIHSDIERGFIRAEVVSFEDMLTYKGRIGAREAGKVKSEGKEYLVQDGDVILFFHN